MKFKWAYCLSEEQYNRFFRIINKIPGFSKYLEENRSLDFRHLISTYKKKLEEMGLSTPGLRTNLELLNHRYELYQTEFKEKKGVDFDLYKILTWSPRPNWTANMSVEEIDYLDHFIPLVPGLSQFLHKHLDSFNLYDLVSLYQMEFNASGKNNPDINFTLETIKERFYRIMDDHEDAIHYVNHSHQIDDHKIIDLFDTEAKNGFYLVNLEKDVCSDFTNKYIHVTNPYIASEIFQRFFKANKVDIALSFAKQTFSHIFSSPNIYWHNKEAVYGSANILNIIIEALSHKGFTKLEEKNPKTIHTAIESLYLLLSRIIYWIDKETEKKEYYDDTLLPINVQHKLRAYRLRSNLIISFPIELLSNVFTSNEYMMGYSDLYAAHFLAYTNRIVGKKSLFLNEAIKLFHMHRLFEKGNPEQVSEKGFLMNDNLAQAIHKKYKEGKYVLTEKEISDFISSLRLYFRLEKAIALKINEPISYLIKDHYSPAYKPSSEKIRHYLMENGIKCFYHFTDRNRLNSIIKYGGLMSYKRCIDEGLVIPIREDMAISRDIDAQKNLEDYARLSFCQHLPKIDIRQDRGAELIMLKISIEVALFEDTEFTDIEATQPGMRHGPTFDDLMKVNLSATKKDKCLPDDPDYLAHQAEVMVKGIIPLKYILNIDNPIIINS